MSDPAVLKALCKETKALILVSEFEARRMPMFQLRSVLETLARDDEERKSIIDMVDNDLRATGYAAETISTFLTDLCAPPVVKANQLDPQILATRKLRSPFSMGFDASSASTPVPESPVRNTFGPSGVRPVSSTFGTISPRPNTSFIPPPPADISLPPPDVPMRPGLAASASSHVPPPPLPGALPPPPKAPLRGGATVSPTRRTGFIPKPSGDWPVADSAPGTAPAPGAGLNPAGDNASPRQSMYLAGADAAKKPVVLLADDDKRARMVFRMRLDEAGFTTVEVGTGTDAWERIQQGGLAAAILDMKMPGLHGLEVLSHMSDKQMALPVVICTAYDQLEDEFVVQTYPRLKYLVKPIAPEALIAALKDLLAAK